MSMADMVDEKKETSGKNGNKCLEAICMANGDGKQTVEEWQQV